MFDRSFELTSHWRVQGTREEVWAVLREPRGLPRWWPEVYLEVREVSPGDPTGVGQTSEIWSRGWLPYTLRWRMRVEELEPPARSAITATGDLVGRGEWRLAQDGDSVDLVYRWRVRAERPLFRLMAPFLKAVMAWNHRWAMAKGEEALRRELMRRRRSQPGPSAWSEDPAGSS